MPNRGIRVESMGDGGWIVKGTTNVERARKVLDEEGSADTHKLVSTDARWFRVVPAHPHDMCGLDHTHHLVPDKPDRRGAFPAVVFAVAGSDNPPPGLTRRQSRRTTRRRWR